MPNPVNQILLFLSPAKAPPTARRATSSQLLSRNGLPEIPAAETPNMGKNGLMNNAHPIEIPINAPTREEINGGVQESIGAILGMRR